MTAEYVIVGAGIYGSSIAYALAAAGRTVVLLDRTHVGTGPTGVSSAHVRLLYADERIQELCLRSLRFFQSFGARVGATAGFRETGCAYFIREEDTAVLEGAVNRMRDAGYPIATYSPDAFAEMFPGMQAAADDGLYVFEPEAGFADPMTAAQALAMHAQADGAHVRTGVAVSELVSDGARVTGVRMADGEVLTATRAVVVAAGPWTPQIVATAGVIVPTWAERHVILILKVRDARRVMPSIVDDWVFDFYARPENPETLLLGDNLAPPRLESPDQPIAARASDEEIVRVMERAAERFPALADAGISGSFAGLYDTSPDALHIVDWVPGARNLFVACGTSGHGFKMAPAVGHEVARVLTAGIPSNLLDAFRFDRSTEPTRERMIVREPQLQKRRGLAGQGGGGNATY